MSTIANPRTRRDPRLIAGIVSIVVFLVGLALTLAYSGAAAGQGDASNAMPAFAANPTSAAFNALGQSLSALALIVFAAGLAHLFGGWAAPQLVASGTVAASMLLVSAVCIEAIGAPGVSGHTEIGVALFRVSYLAGGPAHVIALALLIGTTALAGRRAGLLPRWLSTAGLVIAAVGLLGVVNLASPPLPGTVTGYLIPAGRFLGFAFIAATVPVLWRRTRSRR